MKFLGGFQSGQIYRFRADPLIKDGIVNPQWLNTGEAYAIGSHVSPTGWGVR